MALGGKLRFVVLVGDVDPTAVLDEAIRARSTPTRLVEAMVNIHWGSEPEIAADNFYADLDGDEIPDAAIGRLPVDTAEELTALVQKIIAYESDASRGAWRRQVNFVAGVGGFGSVIDSVLESATKKFLTEGIPAAYRTTFTYGSWRSPLCPDPRRFQTTALARFNEGCLFWVYIGHGHPDQLDTVNTPAGRYSIFSKADAFQLRAHETPPIAVFLACYTGAFDGGRESLAEEMLRAPGGPVAVLAGSRVTMPYAMAVLGTNLMDEVFQKQRPTIGEALLHAKRRLVATPDADEEDGELSRREFLDTMARAMSPRPDLLDEERREHLHLFNLLGDPLLRLPRPAEVPLYVAADVNAGEQLTIRGVAPYAGRMTVELICRRDRYTFDPPARDSLPAIDDLPQFDAVYEKANDHRWTAMNVDIPAGAFETTLAAPLEARGHSHVRVYLERAEDFALGAADVYIRKPKMLAAE